jgi:hypothetical protein
VNRYGLQWNLLQDYFAFEETANASLFAPATNQVWVYAKDKSGTSALYLKDDAGNEREIGLAAGISGSGTTNRLTYWSAATVLAANAALTVDRVLFADSNGLPTDSSTFSRDSTSGFVTVKNIASGASLKLDSSNAAHNSGVFFAVNAAALYRIQIEAATSKLQIFGEGAAASALQFDTSRNTLVGTGAVATNATAPFLQLNSCAGTPTGAPSPQAGQIPLVFDSTNNKLYAYSTSWRDLTGGSGSGALSGSGTAGYVSFWSGTNALSADIKFQWDNTNKFLGIGGAPGFQFHGVAPDGNSFNFTLDTYGTGPVGNYRGRAARGTAGSPSQLVADDSILAVSALPYNSSPGFASGARAQILMVSGESQTSTNQGTYMTFRTTPLLSTTIAERFRIGPSGQWGIGGATYGSAGNYFRSGGASAAPTWSTLVLPNTATVNRIPYASATDTWSDSANLAYDGTDFLLGSGTRARMSGQNRFRYLNPVAAMTKTADQTSLTVNVWTAMAWAQEDFDTDTLHDNSTQNTRFTAQIAGKYLFAASPDIDVTGITTPTMVGVRFIKNGNTAVTYGEMLIAYASVADSMPCSSTIISLAATDYVECHTAAFGASGTYSVKQGSTNLFSRFAGVYVGE